ncbi:MAG: PIN domain-containing protein [Treponema sp.]|nr:PIN domain-containing protein [Treponema sp.]
MKALIDTNVILDFLQKRTTSSASVDMIFELINAKKIKGIIAAHTVTNLWYILRKFCTKEFRRTLIKTLFDFFEVSSLNKQKLISAIDRADFSDFEDCLQDECAKEFDADYIVTRNVKDFANSNVKAVSPEEFIQLAR